MPFISKLVYFRKDNTRVEICILVCILIGTSGALVTGPVDVVESLTIVVESLTIRPINLDYGYTSH